MTIGPVISFPIPPYSNLPINPQYYQPSRFVIAAITLGITTTVTTTLDMNYVIGQLVRLLIPATFGARELNEQTGFVISIPASNQVTLNINSQNSNPFINSTATTKAQIVAVGDVNSGYLDSTGRSILPTGGNTNIEIPGSFINISPFGGL